MRFLRAELHQLRILQHVQLEFAHDVNLILGPNASGKTSVLEGLYLLALGRSFRTSRTLELVRAGADVARVRGLVQGPGDGHFEAQISKRRTGLQAQLEGRIARSTSELARRMPLALLTPATHDLVEGGPKERRRLLDWALFHVEPAYLGVWQAYHRALRQRNAWLRSGGDDPGLTVWERELERYGAQLHGWRQICVEAVAGSLEALQPSLLPADLNLRYLPGWDVTEPLAQVLASRRDNDAQTGSTRPGPHRADVVLEIGGYAAAARLSRGQAKLAIATLTAAYSRYVGTGGAGNPAFLVDDFGAELDPSHSAALGELLSRSGCQLFVTATSASLLPAWPGRTIARFHVEQGKVTKAV